MSLKCNVIVDSLVRVKRQCAERVGTPVRG